MENTDRMNKKRLVFILGNLTAFGPFITDFYLPCLPELTAYFGGSASLIQLSLTAGMLGLAAGQLLVGPVTDKYGRRRPLLWCLLLFVLATAGCMLSTRISAFILFRLLQGLTGAAGLVISKAIIADSFTGQDVARYFAVLGIWALGLLAVCRRMPESLAEKDRLQMPVWKTFRCYVPVVTNGKYLVMNLLQSFSAAALIAYISASPFIFQQHFGLTPLQYSICFAGNALGLVVGSSVVMKIRRLSSATPWCSVGLFVTGLLMSVALWLEWPFVLFELVLVPMLFCVGMITPVGITLALNSVTEHRGIASALLGALPFLFGGIVAPLTGLGDMIRSMTTLVLLCSVICLGLYLCSRRWDYSAPEN